MQIVDDNLHELRVPSLAHLKLRQTRWLGSVTNLYHGNVFSESELPSFQKYHLRLFHDIFHNPFRPAAFSPAWQTQAAVGIASQMYEARDFANMPVLADALQDAGCDSPEIFDHCRGAGPHVRGCWVVDLVLGKS